MNIILTNSLLLGSESGISFADFDFRLSMLPTWAQNAALSRPSMAQVTFNNPKTEKRVNLKGAEGKWAEVHVQLG